MPELVVTMAVSRVRENSEVPLIMQFSAGSLYTTSSYAGFLLENIYPPGPPGRVPGRPALGRFLCIESVNQKTLKAVKPYRSKVTS